MRITVLGTLESFASRGSVATNILCSGRLKTAVTRSKDGKRRRGKGEVNGASLL